MEKSTYDNRTKAITAGPTRLLIKACHRKSWDLYSFIFKHFKYLKFAFTTSHPQAAMSVENIKQHKQHKLLSPNESYWAPKALLRRKMFSHTERAYSSDDFHLCPGDFYKAQVLFYCALLANFWICFTPLGFIFNYFFFLLRQIFISCIFSLWTWFIQLFWLL